jgi:hypothetical protein
LTFFSMPSTTLSREPPIESSHCIAIRSLVPERTSLTRIARVSVLCSTWLISGASRVAQSVAAWNRMFGRPRHMNGSPRIFPPGFSVIATADASRVHQ